MINKTKNLKLLPNYKLASFDIVSIYTNILVTNTVQIVRNILIKTNTLHINIINEQIEILTIMLNQNYSTFNDEYFVQNEGVAMGSPLSGLLAHII